MKKFFKHTLAVFLAAVMVFGAAPLSGFVGIELPDIADIIAVKVQAETSGYYSYSISGGYYSYSISDRGAIIRDVDPSISGDIIIPSMLGGYPVIGIYSSAFSGCDSITSITIPDSVIFIGEYAFSGCDALVDVYYTGDIAGWCGIDFESSSSTPMIYADNLYINGTLLSGNLVIPDGVTSIGNDAFCNCDSLTSVTIGMGVTSIDYRAFYDCDSLISITIGEGVTSIGDDAFCNCDSLSNVKIPDNVTSIGDGAFYGCTGLTSVTIPNSVTSIGDGVFRSCYSLTSVTIPDNVTSIGNDAFRYCDSLTSVIIGKGVTSIDDRAFCDCYSLSNVTIPDNVTSIGDSAFYGCTGLTSITIPNSVTSIGGGVFGDCDSLTSVTIGKSVTSIGGGAFGDCDSLSIITVCSDNTEYLSDEYGVLFNKDKTRLIQYPIGNTRTNYIIPNSVTSIGEKAFIYCDSLTSVTIPDSVTSIDYRAFYDCDSLTSITIGKGVTSIGNDAFAYCSSLTSISIPDGVTAIGSTVFDNCFNLDFVHIPITVTKIGSNILDTSAYICSDTENCYAKEYAETNGIEFRLCDGSHSIGENNEPQEDLSTLKILSTYPQNAAKSISATDDLILRFNQPIDDSFYFETAEKEISLRNYYTDEPVLVINDKNYLNYLILSLIKFNGNTITISDIFRKICPGEKYYITISPGIISADGDFSKTFEGITDKDEWTFTYSEEAEKQGYNFEVYSSRSAFNMNKGETMNAKVVLTLNGDKCGQDGISYTIGDSNVAKVKSMAHDESGTTFVIEALNYGVTNLDIIYAAGTLRESFTIKVADEKTVYYLDDVKNRSQGNNPFYTCGLYVDSLDYNESADGRASVSFDVYNNSNCYGAVEVHNASGDLVDCEMIDMFDGEYNTDFVSYGTYAYKVGRDTFNGDLFDNDAYKTEVKTQKTSINVSVPKGGYIVITKNVSQSMPCLLYNVTLLAIEASSSLAKFTTKIETSSDLIKEILEATAEKVTWKKIAYEITSEAAKSTVKDFIKAANETNILAMLEATEGIYKDLDDIYDIFEIDWEDLVISTLKKVAPNIAVEFVTGFALDKLGGNIVDYFFFGPIGIAKHLVMLGTICDYTDVDGTYIYNSQKGETRYSNKVIANSTSIPDDVVFHSVLIKSGKLDDVINYYTGTYEEAVLYDISLIKNGNKIQPNGKVQVSIPIPDGWNASDITVHHEVAYQKYEKLEVSVENGYIVFNTDSFSDFIIADGNIEIFSPEISIKNNPQTRTINYGDILHIKAEMKNVPNGAKIKWLVSNDATGVNCYIDENDNSSCYIKATGRGSCIVYALLVDSEGNSILDSTGNEIYDSQTIKVNSGIFQIIISFFKNLFGLNRTVVQTVLKRIF